MTSRGAPTSALGRRSGANNRVVVLRGSSIQNVRACRVVAIADNEHTALLLVRVAIGKTFLICRMTKRALDMLGIAVGQNVCAQIKSASILDSVWVDRQSVLPTA